MARDDIALTGQGEIAEMLSGMSYTAIHDLLVSTMPYEAAAMNWDLPHLERLRAVQQAEEMAQ